jgi:hypothetical protein
MGLLQRANKDRITFARHLHLHAAGSVAGLTITESAHGLAACNANLAAVSSNHPRIAIMVLDNNSYNAGRRY